MTNLDYVLSGVSSYDGIKEEFQELCDSLWQLNYEDEKTGEIKEETVREVLKAWRKLVA